GRATGYSGGKGGSMHIADMDKHMLGANGIVGGGMGLATGAALTAKLQKTGSVAICFFGDGALEQGILHETTNLAAIGKLPVVPGVQHLSLSRPPRGRPAQLSPEGRSRAVAAAGSDRARQAGRGRTRRHARRRDRGPPATDRTTYRRGGRICQEQPRPEPRS